MTALRPALSLLVFFTILAGFGYPALVTLIGQIAFPHPANGSLIERNGVVIGSELIGQPFDDDRYFHGRPSATAPFPANAGASTGSNLGPLNPALQKAVGERVQAIRRTTPGDVSIPVDLVTASASGLDPHVSPAAALLQVARVARARSLPEERVRVLVLEYTAPRSLGILGEPRVNVLRLNLALDEMAPAAETD
jgi:K+-transporting ATPase ATPase C chain